MGAFPLAGLLLPLALAAGPDPRADTRPGRPLPGGELSAEDARYLDWLIEDFLFDPRRAVRVRVQAPFGRMRSGPDDPGSVVYTERDGWLVAGRGGQPGRVYFTDGESIAAPAVGMREVDFEADADREYRRPRPDGEGRMASWVLNDPGGDTALSVAAGLHRRGYGRLAARALASARAASDDPAGELRGILARRGGRAMTLAFCARQDDAALAHADRLARLYPDLLASPYHTRAARLVADIRRRQQAGSLGRPRPGPGPPGFAGWDDRRKAAFLIDQLDEIGSEEDTEPRYAALVELGDAAVPALIDVVDRDDRLTRTLGPHVPGSGLGDGREEVVIEVRAVAERALRTILRVSNLGPRLPEEDDDRTPAVLVGRLRRYWAAYGHLPFAERMLAVLTDPACRSEARAEAAEELAGHVPVGRETWGRRVPSGRPVPAADRGRVAGAILAALDDEREREGRRRRPTYEERAYLRSLVRLGDPRAGPAVARWAREEATVRSRMAYALAAHDLGVSGPLVGLCRELAAGTLDLGPPRRPGTRSRRAVPDALAQVLSGLNRCGLPEAEAALAALADPAHPYHRPLLADLLATPTPGEFDWAYHPFVVGVLRGGLTDRRPTGSDYFLRGDEVEVIRVRRVTRHPVPEGAVGWREHAEERVADAAAERLAHVVVGLPAPHPLRPDADRVLADLRAVLGRYAGRLRPVTAEERTRVDDRGRDVLYAPDIRPLGRPATAADVRAGRAVFELNGRGRVADVKVPAWVLLKADATLNYPPWGLAVQAEVGPDGAVVYGVIFRHAIRAVRADEVDRIEPWERR